MLAKTVTLHILIVLQSLDVQIHAALGLNILDVSSIQVNTGFFVNNLSLFEGYLALALLDVHVGQSHILMQVLYLVLNIENILLVFLLLPQAPHHKVGKLLGQVLAFLSLSLYCGFCLADEFL